MKTTLRYLLSMVMVLSVLSVSAQTPKYGKTYNPQSERTVFATAQAQMPAAEIGSTSSDWMTSGSSLPNAAVTGTSTTYDDQSNGRPGQIRRIGGNTSGGSDDREDPYKDPIGDAMIPLMLLAGAYLGMRVFLKRKRALSRSANESQRPNHSANW